ncbi:MAG: cytidine deaminase [Bacteroidales bacterium]|jgi:cytidine deaminase
MEHKSIQINYYSTNNIKDLSEDDQLLINEAVKATKKSYAPYSKYNVGAAVALINGDIVSGANQENASSPVSICAEQVTVSAALMKYPNTKITKIAITASTDFSDNTNNCNTTTESEKDNGNPVSPCGMCRQFLSEIQNRQKSNIKIILHNPKGKTFVFDSVEDLLPLSFSF